MAVGSRTTNLDFSRKSNPGAKAVNAFSRKLVVNLYLLFSTFQHNPESPTENTAMQSSSYSSGTLFDHTELVPGTLGDAGRPPFNNDSLIEHIVSPYPPNNTSPSASQVKTSTGSYI